MRDKVIKNVKDSFMNSPKKDYPQILDGKVTVVATGSSQSGLWTASGSDVDLVIVFGNRMAYNQH